MKAIFFKLLMICFLLLSFSFFHFHEKKSKKTYQGQNQDVYVNVKMDDQVYQVELDDYLLGVVAGYVFKFHK